MSLLTSASAASAWRGYEYYEQRKVREIERISDSQFRGVVAGTDGAVYDVLIDLEHPRKSTCTCPHAAGKRIVCKHKIALFFMAFPQEAEKYYHEVVEYELEQERLQEERERKLEAFVKSMTKSQLQNLLLDVLQDGPEWQYDQFMQMYVENDPFADDEDDDSEWWDTEEE